MKGERRNWNVRAKIRRSKHRKRYDPPLTRGKESVLTSFEEWKWFMKLNGEQLYVGFSKLWLTTSPSHKSVIAFPISEASAKELFDFYRTRGIIYPYPKMYSPLKWAKNFMTILSFFIKKVERRKRHTRF
jgi:hypothetical protein